jgi:flagellar basal-body rod protein FlgF
LQKKNDAGDMLREVYIAAQSMLNQQTRLEVTANNMANANSTGFKRGGIFERNLNKIEDNMNNVPGDVEQKDAPIGQYTDFSNGPYRHTGNPLDLAIDGEGYFTVMEPGGKEFLTRAGNFQLSQGGELITMDGKKLIGADGPVTITDKAFDNPFITGDKKSLNILITERGEIFANDTEVGKISMEKVDNPETLKRLNAGIFEKTEQTESEPVEPREVKVKQGWLEESNVKIVNEMVEMIELQRHFELGQKIVQVNDGTLENSIRMGRYY